MSDEAQLEFDLPRVPPRAACSLAGFTWRTRRDGMVESRPDGSRRVYGLWQRLFGCWDVTNGGRGIREVVPAQPFMTAAGAWDRTLPDTRADHGLRLLAPARSAGPFSDLIGGIPLSLRQLVAETGRFQWLLLDLIRQEPGFAGFLEQARDQGRIHYVHACLSLAGACGLSRSHRRELARDIPTEPRQALMSRLSGVECSRSVPALLARVRGRAPLSAEAYAVFVDVMTSPHHGLLSHVREVTQRRLDALRLLPLDAWFPNVLDLAERWGPCGISRLVRGVLDRAPETERCRAASALGSVRRSDELREWWWRWHERLRIAVPFYPPPPLTGHSHLKAIDSDVALRDEGVSMNNCVAGYLDEVLDGRGYFYHWVGEGLPATVLLVRAGDGAWEFAEALGPTNTPLSEEQYRLVQRAARILGARIPR